MNGQTRTRYLQAVKWTSLYCAETDELAKVVARRAVDVETMDAFEARVLPALEEYGEQLPAPLFWLLSNPPRDT